MSSVSYSTSIVERNGESISLSRIRATVEKRFVKSSKFFKIEAPGKTLELSSRVFCAMALQGYRISDDKKVTVDCSRSPLTRLNSCSVALCAISALKEEVLSPGYICLADVNARGELLPCRDVVKITLSLVEDRTARAVIVSRLDAQRLTGLCTRIKIYACRNLREAYECATENAFSQDEADVMHVPDNRVLCPEKAPRRILETLYVAARGHHNILFVGPVKLAAKYARMLAEKILPKPYGSDLDSAWAKNNDSSFSSAPLVKISHERLSDTVERAEGGVLFLGGLYHLNGKRRRYLTSFFKKNEEKSPILVAATDVKAYGSTPEEAVEGFKAFAKSPLAELFDIVVIVDKDELFPISVSNFLKEKAPLTPETLGKIDEPFLTSSMRYDAMDAFGSDLERVTRVAATLKAILHTPFLRWDEMETAANNFCHLNALLKAIEPKNSPDAQVSTTRV